MGVGALCVALNVAPTGEVVRLAVRMDAWDQLGMVAVSLATMHAFVYALGFAGTEVPMEGEHPVATFMRFTLVGYILVLAMSLYILWTFGRLDGLSPQAVSAAVVVQSFPGAIGAAAARLIL